MESAKAIPSARPGGSSGTGLAVGLAALGALVVGLASTGSALLPAVPVVVVAVLHFATILPLRTSAAFLLFLLLGLDETVETAARWHTPLAGLADLLHYRIDMMAGIPGLAVTGMELAIALLLGVYLHRRSAASRAEGAGPAPAPRVLRAYFAMYVAAVLLSDLFGMAKGLPMAPWKMRNLLQPLLLAALFLAAVRRASDFGAMGRAVVAAGCTKAVLAFVIQRAAMAETGGYLAYATSHGDSVLFAVAAALLLADALEHGGRSRWLRNLPLLAVLFLGMVYNNRRLVWVVLAVSAATAFLVSPMRGWKRAFMRAALVLVPLVGLYVGVGWGRPGRIFAPVNALRTVADPRADRSAFWRDVENWNLAMSLRDGLILGVGLGAHYTEYMANDDVTGGTTAEGYKEYRAWPHNSILGMLLFMGVFGYTASAALLSLVVFWAVRSYRVARAPDLRVAALGCLTVVVSCQLLAWGDTGAHYPQYKVLLGLAIAISARLAVASGAWPGSGRLPAGPPG